MLALDLWLTRGRVSVGFIEVEEGERRGEIDHFGRADEGNWDEDWRFWEKGKVDVVVVVMRDEFDLMTTLSQQNFEFFFGTSDSTSSLSPSGLAYLAKFKVG